MAGLVWFGVVVLIAAVSPLIRAMSGEGQGLSITDLIVIAAVGGIVCIAIVLFMKLENLLEDMLVHAPRTHEEWHAQAVAENRVEQNPKE